MKNILLFVLLILISVSCKKNRADQNQDSLLVKELDQKINPLTENPLTWNDNDLKFLDPIADKSIIGLGEATHGTAEFFKAKQRIFKYLAENHKYRIFAIEADFGESLLINDAVQRGAVNEIEELMKSKMHFWTWKTEEVKDLLEWMCTYNLDKPDAEKVQYVGIDCQFNTYNADMVKNYLTRTNSTFLSMAGPILDEAKTSSEKYFASYTPITFRNYLDQIDSLQDAFVMHKNELIEASSEQQYLLNERILEIVKQVSEVDYHSNQASYNNYRDKYMAENAAWLLNYFEDEKVVLWAHNGHIAYTPKFLTMGFYLTNTLSDNYANVGFLFSTGTFTAVVSKEGGGYSGPIENTIDSDPIENSLNKVMSQSKAPVFAIKLSDLQGFTDWNNAFNAGLLYLSIGAFYNDTPADFYTEFRPDYFDYMIYFDHSTASVQL